MNVQEPLVRFLGVLRGAGVRISVSEGLDAMQVVEVVGYKDRTLLRDALGLAVAKSVEEEVIFETCFDEFFCRETYKKTELEHQASSEKREGISELGQTLLDGDQTFLAQMIERAANDLDISQIRIFTQVNLFTMQILDLMGIGNLGGDISMLNASGNPQMSLQAERLETARDELRIQVRDFVQRQLKIYAKGEYDRIRDGFLRQVLLNNLDENDSARIRVIIRQIARRLATRHSRNFRTKRKGKLDVRKIIRLNIANDNVLFRTSFRSKRTDRPKIIAICDVSRSVITSAEFLLLFLWNLREVVSGMHAFAFSNDMVEVTKILDKMKSEEASREILTKIGFRSTDYGNSLATFRKNFFGLLDRKTTVIILGDARGNKNNPRADIVREISERSKRLIWLNPEARTYWGTGDSDMLRYKNYCNLAKTCNTITDLETVVSDLLEVERFG